MTTTKLILFHQNVKKTPPSKKKKKRKKRSSCQLSQISVEVIWFGAVKKAVSVRQLVVTYAEVSELLMIRQHVKNMNHEKDLG